MSLRLYARWYIKDGTPPHKAINYGMKGVATLFILILTYSIFYYMKKKSNEPNFLVYYYNTIILVHKNKYYHILDDGLV